MKNRYVFLIILGLGVITYINSFFNPFVYDDYPLIVTNQSIKSLSNIPYFFFHSFVSSGQSQFTFLHSYYRPVIFTIYSTFYYLFGTNPFPFHIFQLIVHSVNTYLVFLILGSFFELPVSLFLALILLVHPINTETVISIAYLQDILFLFFGLSSLYLIVRKKESPLNFSDYFLLTLFFLFSLLSKESALLFLLIIPIYTFLFSKKNIKGILLPIATSLLFYLPLRYNASFHRQGLKITTLISQSDLITRMMTIPKIILYYVSKFLVPINFSISQEWLVKRIEFKNFYLPLIFDVLLFGIIMLGGLYLFLKKRGLSKIYFFFSVWFFLGLLIHLQILPLSETVSIRWFYFPIIGLLGILGIYANLVFSYVKHKNIIKMLSFIASIFIIIILICLTIIRNSQWQSNVALYIHDLKYAEVSPQLNNLYGTTLMNDHKFEEARQYFEKSYTQNPYFGTNLDKLAQLYEIEGDYRKAKLFYWKRVKLEDGFSKHTAYEGLIRITLFAENNATSAKQISDQAMVNYSWDPVLRYYTAIAEYLTGDKEKALKDAEILLRQDPVNKVKYLYDLIRFNKLTIDKFK